MTEKSFFLVWSPTEIDTPKHRYDTFASADVEAERLVKCSGSTEFYVLEVVRKVKRVDIQRTDFDRN